MSSPAMRAKKIVSIWSRTRLASSFNLWELTTWLSVPQLLALETASLIHVSISPSCCNSWSFSFTSSMYGLPFCNGHLL